MKKILIYTIMLACAASIGFAQNRKADSLKSLLNKNLSDSAKIDLLVELSRVYYLQRPDIGLCFAAQALTFAKKTGNKKGEMRALTQTGFSLWVMGDMPAASQSFISSLHLAEQLNDKWSIARNYDGMGDVYAIQNEFKLAIPYALKSVHIFSEVRDYENVVNGLSDIGDFYNSAGKLDSAMLFDERALALSVKINEWTWRPKIIKSLGTIYWKLGKRDTALAYMHKAITICLQYKETFLLTNAYYGLAEIFQKSGQRDSCIFYAKKAFALAKKSSVAYPMANASILLAHMYDGNNETEAAGYYKVALDIKDSLFKTEKTNQLMIIDINRQQRETDLKNAATAYQNKIKLYASLLASALVIVILLLVWRSNQKQKKANILLESQKKQIQEAYHHLKLTQNQLIQSEKMASLGELTAGIAHEIQNPLNFVNNFSEVSVELLAELREEAEAGRIEDVVAITNDLSGNLEKIRHHGKRAEGIVKGMLEHSRASTGQKEPTNLNKLADEYLRLAYHGLRAKDKSFNAELVTYFDEKLPPVNVIPQDIGRVMLNLLNNAFYAVHQKAKTAGPGYKPTVEVSTSQAAGQIVISVKDNGHGIPGAIRDKIMQPFFTTKPTGEGTGLGLSLSYDIVVKGHGGKIYVDTNDGEFTRFNVEIPFKSES